MTIPEVAVFGGGCFWCTEALFRELKGIISVMPGYAGGSILNPTYEDVSQESTGHAEVIKIVFDPSVIKYADLLTVFFATHDPTTVNRQGADSGTQYRSIILYTTEAQEKEAKKFIAELNAHPEVDPIVTLVEPLQTFYEAEEYHWDYYRKNQNAPYCDMVINPKLKKLKQRFAQLLS